MFYMAIHASYLSKRNELVLVENSEGAVQKRQSNAEQYTLQINAAPLLAIWNNESFIAKHLKVLIVQLIYQVCCLLVIVLLPLVRGVLIMLVVQPSCMHTATIARFDAVGPSAVRRVLRACNSYFRGSFSKA